jgi:hypothetical protein
MTKTELQIALVAATQTSKRTAGVVFEKALGVYQATSVPEAQRRLQDLFESSLATLRTSVENALNTNAKIVASWKDCLEVCEITAVAARH